MLLDRSLGRREAWCVPVIGLLQMSRPGKSLCFTIWRKSKLKMSGDVKYWSCLTAWQNPPGFPGTPPPRALFPSTAPCHHLPSPPSCRERNGSGWAGKSHRPAGTCRDRGQPRGTLGGQHHRSPPCSPRTSVVQLVVASQLLFSDDPQDVIQNWTEVASNPPLDRAW